MLNTRSFADILDDLNDAAGPSFGASAPANDYRAGWESNLEPFGMAQLLGRLQPQAVPTRRAYRAYPQRPVPPPPPARPRPAHTLTPEQAAAFAALSARAPVLAANFNLRELKSAYRAAVLATHPDRGGTSESFQEVRKSYHILAALVKN